MRCLCHNCVHTYAENCIEFLSAVIKHLTKSDLEKEEIPDGVFIMVLSVEARDRLLQMNLSWVLDPQENSGSSYR